MITIKDIAQQLNLSASTVGRALADHPRISRATKERVGIAADRLGYVASTPARVMRGGSSHLVGLLVPDIHNHFYSLVAHGLSKCFKDDGLHLALSITDDDPDTEVERVREMVSARVAGIVIVPSASPRRETLKLLKLVPHIQLLRHAPAFRADWFGMNDEGALFDATNHLLSLGHRRISYVGDVIFSTGRARYEGFRRACAQAGIQPEEALVELGPPTVSFGAAALSRLLEQSIPPTALLTASVPVTLGVVEQLEALEVAVPGTLSIIALATSHGKSGGGPGSPPFVYPSNNSPPVAGCGFAIACIPPDEHRVMSRMSRSVRACSSPAVVPGRPQRLPLRRADAIATGEDDPRRVTHYHRRCARTRRLDRFISSIRIMDSCRMHRRIGPESAHQLQGFG
jgi:LacI family repressor for deo operon, udp, cdd, tsx, nupC, and nupG